MTGSSLCHKLGLVLVCFAFVVLIGCGGSSPVDGIIKEQKAIAEEVKNAKGDIEKLKAAQAKSEALMKKITTLTDAQKKEYGEKMAKEMGLDLKGKMP